jgi:hypothetical protein
MLVMVPADAAAKIRAGTSWGNLTFRVSEPENIGAVIAVSDGHGNRLPMILTPKTHFLNSADSTPSGYWYKVRPDLHAAWVMFTARGEAVPLGPFADSVAAGFKSPGAAEYLALTHAPGVASTYPDMGVPDLLAWHVSAHGAMPISLEVEPEAIGMVQLAEHWPVETLQRSTVLLVGAGSIGGAAAHALAAYGVGRLLLLDPDRLLWHNLVRHVSDSRNVGKLKVTALRDELEPLRPDTTIEPFPLDVVADADQVRGLLPRVNVVLCTVDGVNPRRVVSHLARRGGTDAVLACVLEDGAVGEVLRLRPWKDHGCLTCERDALVEAGAFDPEPSLEAGYGAGTRHRAMTAVGADLHLVGQFAAKLTVATLLERHGIPEQRLPGDHMLLALRPRPDWPAPFDLRRAGDVRWRDAAQPRPGCPTCEDP